MTIEERKKELTPLMKRFAEAYLEDPSDGGAAYLRANPKCSSKKSASVQASKYLKMPKIKQYIEDKAQETLGTRKVAILKNVDFWLGVRDGNLKGESQEPTVSKTRLMDLLAEFGAGDELVKAVKGLTVYPYISIKFNDRMKASENLGKYMQMFVEKKEISVEAQVVIKDDI